MMYRQPYLTLRIENATQVAPGNCKIRPRLYRFQIARLNKNQIEKEKINTHQIFDNTIRNRKRPTSLINTGDLSV